MRAVIGIVMATACSLAGCGELIFGASNGYSLEGTGCKNLAKRCGAESNEDCCTSPIVESAPVRNAGSAPREIGNFRLDKFEVTVGRFREFIKRYPQNRPEAGQGYHPRIPQSGWKPQWDAMLPVDQDALLSRLHCSETLSTWTDVATNREFLPINCVDWYLAFAFCAWDDGRLPTEAEWLYAAEGGDRGRILPWSNPPDDRLIDFNHASYDCLADGSDRWQCALTDILAVGSRSPDGNGFFGQSDLAGSMREWTLDAFQVDTPNPCHDCAVLPKEPLPRVLHGGAWDLDQDLLLNSTRQEASPGFRFQDIGFRCARDI